MGNFVLGILVMLCGLGLVTTWPPDTRVLLGMLIMLTVSMIGTRLASWSSKRPKKPEDGDTLQHEDEFWRP